MSGSIEETVRDEAILRAALAEADIAPLLTSPWRLLDYWPLTRHSVPEEYRARRPGHGPIIPGHEAGSASSIERLAIG